MGKIVISANVTLDGVIQDATGQGEFRLAGWFDRIEGKDREAWAKVEFEEALSAEALLLGRVTYQWFVARGWASRSGEWAARLRDLPKYVVSSTLENPEWENTETVAGDVVDGISNLKQKVDGDIVVYGSGRLVHALMENDLVDELRLMICPVALGAGERLFGETSDEKPMRLIDTRTVGDNLALLTYQPA